MKTNFKRLFALLLTLCMLASLMVPVAFADDEAVAAPSANVAETYNIRLVDMTQVDSSNRTGWNTNFGGSSGYKSTGVKAWDKDAQVWNYNTTLTNKIDAAYADGSLDWKYLDSESEATYREDRMMQLRSSGWVAIQIRVSASGMYALNIASDKNDPVEGAEWTNLGKTNSGNVAAYIVPVADFSVENIAAIMVDENSVGTVYLSADATSVTFAKQRMEAGEYVVIYDGPSDYSVCEMSLLGDAYELERVATYDLNPFDLTNPDPATYAGTVNESLVTAKTDETTGETTYTFKDYVGPGTGVSYAVDGWKALTYNGTWRAQKAAMYNPCLKQGGDWAALTLNVPASGEVYMSLFTDRSTPAAPFSNSYGQTCEGIVTAYLVPVSAGIVKANVATYMTDDYNVGTQRLFADTDTITFEKTYVEAGEYVVIIHLDSILKQRYAISEIRLDKVAGQELPESEKLSGTVATYDFEIYNNERYAPIFTKEDGTTGSRGWGNGAFSGYEGAYAAGTDVSKILDKDYAAGIINYKLETLGNINSSTFEGDATDTNYGLRIQKTGTTEAESRYMALRLNVPATSLYTVIINTSYNSVGNLNIYTYAADAEGTVADNMTEANLAASLKAAKTLSFEDVLTAGDNIIVFEIAATTAKDTLRLLSIELTINSEPVTYNFDLVNNEAFKAAVLEGTNGQVTAIPTDTGMKYYTYIDESGASQRFYVYSALASLFAKGNAVWAQDTCSLSNANEPYASVRTNDGNIRFIMEQAEVCGYGAVRIRVATAGTYNITLNAYGNSGGITAYLIPATNTYTGYSSRMDVASYMTDEYKLGSTSSSGDKSITAPFSFAAAGEYVLALAENEASNGSIYLSTMTMEPVVASFVADGAGYGTLEDAIAKATDYVFMAENARVNDLVIPAGVTLDLNGKVLYANSVDASAPGAQIIDSTDGQSLLRGAIEFNENNAQLPLYDIDADGYYLFNVDVDAHATTGSGSKTKFWFKINFSNTAALELIGMNTELRIMATMSGVYKENVGEHLAGDSYAATAKAEVAFTQTWAANNTSYVVISAVGSKLSSFQLNPGVTANGVVISGAAMGKG